MTNAQELLQLADRAPQPVAPSPRRNLAGDV